MGANGEMMTANVGANWNKHGPFHHTSMSSGAEVAAAGEMRVNQGHLETIADSSGHYAPTAPMTYQALKSLQQQNVDLSRTGVDLSPKNPGEKALQLSATEFMSYKPEMEQALEMGQGLRRFAKPHQIREMMATPENKIREAHQKKSDFLAGLMQDPRIVQKRIRAEEHSPEGTMGQRPQTQNEFAEAIKGTKQATSSHSRRMTPEQAQQEQARLQKIWKQQNGMSESAPDVNYKDFKLGYGPEAE
jgi:hypothetical protein